VAAGNSATASDPDRRAAGPICPPLVQYDEVPILYGWGHWEDGARALEDKWPDWGRWVRALHPTLDIGGVTGEALAGDPGLLPAIYRRIAEERARRTPTGESFGQRDLVEAVPKVRARQERIRRERRAHAETARARAERTRAKLRAYFPFVTV
jgi:hypothetical protein